jgi:hypothetical protein
MDNSDTLYICKWQFGNLDTTYLDLFNFNSKECFRI